MHATFDNRCSETDAKAARDQFRAMDNLWSQVRAVGLAWGPLSEGRHTMRSLDETTRGAFQPSAETERVMFKNAGRIPL